MAVRVSEGGEMTMCDSASVNEGWELGWVRIHTEDNDLDSERGRRLIAAVGLEEG